MRALACPSVVLIVGLTPAAAPLTAQAPVPPWRLEEAVTAEDGREIVFTLELPTAPEALFRQWTTEEGAGRFLAPEVRIETRVGGRYEARFDPENDPAGALAGTYGSRIVSLEPPSRLVFQWNCPTPRVAARDVGGRRVLQESLVEVRFEPAGERGEATWLRVRHYGMGDGPDWDASYRYYRDRGWPWILGRLRELYSPEESPSEDPPPSG